MAIPPVSISAPTPGVAAKPAGTSGGVSPRPAPALDEAAVRAAVAAANEFARSAANSLEFSIDRGTGKTIIRVVDADTNQLIRQIPSEEMIAIAHALDRLQGLLLQNEA